MKYFLTIFTFLFPTLLLAQSIKDYSEFRAYSPDSLLEVHYNEATNRCFRNIKIFYKSKTSAPLKFTDTSVISGVDISEYCYPSVFSKHIIKVEKDVYAIVAYNWLNGVQIRNVWIIKYERKKLHLAASFVTNYDGGHEMNIISNIDSNYVKVQFLLNKSYTK